MSGCREGAGDGEVWANAAFIGTASVNGKQIIVATRINIREARRIIY